MVGLLYKFNVLKGLLVALQREAMVTVLYKAKLVKAQLEASAQEEKVPTEVVDVILRALVAVWAQESGHQAYFEAMLKAIDLPKKFMDRIDQILLDIRGRVEGTVTSGLSVPKQYSSSLRSVRDSHWKDDAGCP